jgi:hypothetical protein
MTRNRGRRQCGSLLKLGGGIILQTEGLAYAGGATALMRTNTSVMLSTPPLSQAR